MKVTKSLHTSRLEARLERDYPHRPEPGLDCPTCGNRYTFYTVPLTGVAWQRCRCGESPVPIKRLAETVRHDQTTRRDAALGRWFHGATSPVAELDETAVPKRRHQRLPKGSRSGHPWTNRAP